MLKIFCKNNGETREFMEGTTLLEMLTEFKFEQPFQIISAKVNNVSQGLKFKVYNSRDVEFVDGTSYSGRRVYCRSLCFLLAKSARDVFPGSRLYFEHPISNGYYCNFYKADGSLITNDEIALIKFRMRELIARDVPFHRHEARTCDAIGIFSAMGYDDKVKLIETSGQSYTDYYTLDGTPDYYYGRLVPSAGYLQVWDVLPFDRGMLLMTPNPDNPKEVGEFIPQPKTFNVFAENLKWNIIMGLSTVGDLNHACQNGKGRELIQISEALQEKKIVQIAEEIDRRARGEAPLKLVLITGPSSSGKTTFCKRLSIQLKACGIKPLTISTDDYFVNRVDTPLLPDGKYDFDNFNTVDHRKLQNDLQKIIAGESVEVPEFNFVTGKREYNGKTVKLEEGNVLLLEGIHALNPKLTDKIDESVKFRIFISTLTSISLDDHNWIPTSDNRLLRRIVRDYNKGAFTATQTISQWGSVRAAEQKWIYPYQENADVMFNSAYLVEFAVLRTHAEPILASVPKNSPEYSEAHRLLKFIHYFVPVSDKEIPATSLIREFI